MFQLCDTALLYVKYFCPSIKMSSKRALRVVSPVIAAIRLITMIAGIPLAHSLQHVSNTPVRFSSSLTAEQFNFIRLFFYFRSPPVMSEYVSPPHGETLCSSLGVVWIVCAPFNGPVQGNGHVAPPDRISLEDNGSTDRVSCAYTYWPV